MRSVVLLGPQRLEPTLVRAVDEVGVKGTIAAVTAGWQEREDEIDELSAHLARPVVNLRLHHRGEDVFARDPELLLAYGDLLDHMRQMQDLYRIRLAHAKDATRALLKHPGDPDLIEPEVAAAIDALRGLDAHHRERVGDLYDAFESGWKPQERPAVAHHREEIAKILKGCEGLALAGGHVQVLLDRLRLFGVADAAGSMPVFAWSAGAMVACETVVLFHDSPPQGAGNAEILGPGLGLCRGVIPFPHARRRLKTSDPQRVTLLARRFFPMRCLAMDEGSRATWTPRRGLRIHAARELLPSGEVTELTPS